MGQRFSAAMADKPILGVTLENARSCLPAGAAAIAAIRLFEDDDIVPIARTLRSLSRNTLHPVHLVPCSSTCIAFLNRRARVSFCFAPSIQMAISFLCVNAIFSQFAFATLSLVSAFFSTAGASTVGFSSSRSISTSTMSPALTPAPLRRVLFTGIMCQPPIGISDERKGKPLIVPRTGTRARVRKNSGTSGGVIAELSSRKLHF
jgi:hypothetical protein